MTYTVGLTSPAREDFATFDDLNFTPPRARQDESWEAYLNRAKGALRAATHPDVTVTLFSDGEALLRRAFDRRAAR